MRLGASVAVHAPSTGTDRGVAHETTTRVVSGQVRRHGECRAALATVTHLPTDRPVRLSSNARFSGATTDQLVPEDLFRAAASEGAVRPQADHRVLAALGQEYRVRAGSGQAGRAPLDLGQARHARVQVRASTTDALPGVTATRVTVARPLGVTATTPAARQGEVGRLGLGAMTVTIRLARHGARDRLATCCTVVTPSWRHSGPAGRFDE